MRLRGWLWNKNILCYFHSKKSRSGGLLGVVVKIYRSRLEQTGAVSLKQRWTLTDTLLESRRVRNSEWNTALSKSLETQDSIVKVSISKTRLFLGCPKL